MARRLPALSYLPAMFVLVLLAFGSAVWSAEKSDENSGDGQPTDKPEKSEEDYYELFELFVDSLDQIERNYVKEVSRRQLVEAAIEGMIDKLDPHSSYITPNEVDQFRSNVENKFGGIGIHVAIEAGQLTVVSPLVGAPAYRAGVLAGDRILEIEGKSAKGISLDEAVRRLKGEVGTEVSIKVRNGSDGELRSITIGRDIVQVETVLGHLRNDDDSWSYFVDEDQRIGYIRINSFSRDTARTLRKIVKQLEQQEVRGLVLDLRFNPGGLLTSAIEVCDLFVSKGRIVSTNGRNTRERTWDAKQAGTFEGVPMVVLINRFSASASEIVSACLQDHGRAVIMGERSYGKGSVQNVIELEDGKSVLKLTTAGYQRPSGKNIHRFPDTKDSDDWGVTPVEENRLRLGSIELRRLLAHRRKIFIARGLRPEASEEESDDPDAREEPTDELDTGEEGTDQSDTGESDTGESDTGEEGTDESDTGEPDDDPKDAADDATADGPQSASVDVFVDRQLQKAVEYLSNQLAQAETKPADTP